MSVLRKHELDQIRLACNQTKNGQVVLTVNAVEALGALNLLTPPVLATWKRGGKRRDTTCHVPVNEILPFVEGKKKPEKPAKPKVVETAE